MHSCSSEQQGSIGFPSSPKVQALPAATHTDEGIIVGPGVGSGLVGSCVGRPVGLGVDGAAVGPADGSLVVGEMDGTSVGLAVEGSGVGLDVGGSDVTQRVPEPIIMHT